LEHIQKKFSGKKGTFVVTNYKLTQTSFTVSLINFLQLHILADSATLCKKNSDSKTLQIGNMDRRNQIAQKSFVDCFNVPSTSYKLLDATSFAT
jgi:hypothetical protein